ncbi:GNAT family N-acetyltransferase [Myroides fluvii]|uniref:GNAT family N-acetyltransferase n=1 Tax=Myroides fluvii TaxID=2572594 RepID=UPI00131CF2C4|nr:GNAT family N-acetyltransferase [Myroides fluvii]
MESIQLVQYTADDFAVFYSLVQQDSVMRYVSGQGLTEEEARKKFNSILEINAQNPALGTFKIYDATGTYLGDGKMEWNKRDSSLLEIGYILEEKHWGKGYGTQICTALLALAEQTHPTTSIIGLIYPENIASKKLLEKFGFKSYFVGVEDNMPTEKLILEKGK